MKMRDIQYDAGTEQSILEMGSIHSEQDANVDKRLKRFGVEESDSLSTLAPLGLLARYKATIPHLAIRKKLDYRMAKDNSEQG